MALPKYTISAGLHDRRDCPLEFRPEKRVSSGNWKLVSDDGAEIDLQVDGTGLCRCVIPELRAGESKTFRVEAGGDSSGNRGVSLRDNAGALEILDNGALVSRYTYRDVPARPYFYPVNAPGQIPVTRAYPMEPKAPGETRDHPHHRSMWIAHGEVNDADNWSEERGHGHTRHERFEHVTNGIVTGSFASRSLWTTARGEPILTQHLGVAVWAGTDTVRTLDFSIVLEATHGEVRFGDTKEGGILSVRVASEMDVPRTGRISNVFGGIDEAETWGKSAHWCDYSGTIAGARAGIAIMDHPFSFRYPTHWHVRNYGLMTANPFGYAAYTNGVKNGGHTLAASESLTFRYRVILHKGAAEEANIAARYLDFVAPATVTAN